MPAKPSTALSPPLALVARALRGYAGALGGFSVAIALLLLVPTVYMLQVYDRVLSSRNEVTLALLTLGALGLFALLAALEAVRSAICVRLAAGVNRSLAPEVFRAALNAPAGSAQQLMASDLATLRQFVAGPVPALCFDTPLGLLFLAMAFAVDPWLGLFVAASLALLVGVAVWHERRARAPALQANRAAAEAAQALAETINHAEAARALGMRGALARRWLGLNEQAAGLQAELSVEAAHAAAVTRLLRLATQSLALGLGALLVLEQRISPGMMMATTLLLGRALSPIEGLVGQSRQMLSAHEAWQRLNGLLSQAAPAEPLALPAPSGKLSVEGLGWQAGAGQAPLLHGIRFELAPGRGLAVVGPSGAGKSTLARLLAGGLAPTQGAVRLDGAELAQWPEAQRAGAIGYLPQDVELFEGTVAENIARMGEVDAAAVVQAAQQAGIHELLLRLPEGYQTRLGRGGLQLSGGQRQRLGLARALFGQPVLLVLDEPNAHLDEQGEQALRQALQAHKAAGGAFVVVSHRLPLLQVVDDMLVLQAGRQAAFGPRDEVLHNTLRAVPQAHQARQA